jgi:thioredoxin:protein disulfide reductase
VLGLSIAFALLGVAAAWSGQNLQMALQSVWAVGALVVVFVVLAASMFGGFELQLPSAWTSRLSRDGGDGRRSLPSAAGLGFVSALIVGPCVTAPLAGALLYIAQTGDVGLGAAALFFLGLGKGVPLIVFGTVGARFLPKAGPWMDRVKMLFGFIFLGMAWWLASRILPPTATLASRRGAGARSGGGPRPVPAAQPEPEKRRRPGRRPGGRDLGPVAAGRPQSRGGRPLAPA